MKIVIIGNGVAGIEAARELRRLEPSWSITIVSEESDHFFSRTALMWVHCGQMSYRDIEPYERNLYDASNFTRVRARATGIDAEGKRVRLAGGHAPLPFDQLLICCGSKPRPGPWSGADLPGVGHFVTLQDLEWFEREIHGGPGAGRAPNADGHLPATTEDSPYLPRSAAADASGRTSQHPVVIGGGLIGIEAVEIAVAAGLRPRFFIREEWFWPIALDKRESHWISKRMEHHGVQVHLNENVETLKGDSVLQSIQTDKGEYDADSVVVAIGVVPNTDWLSESPIERDRGGGIVVDEQLRSNVAGVFAAGDCASVTWFGDMRRPEQLWYTGRDQGRAAARAMTGQPEPYRRGLWYNSAKLMDIEYTTAGLVNMNIAGEENWFFEETGPVTSTTRITVAPAAEGGSRVIGFNLLGRRWDHEPMLRWIDEKRSLEFVLEHLQEAAFDTEFVPPLQLPAQAVGLTGAAPSGLREPIPYPFS